MYLLIGKQYSKETNLALAYLKARHITFEFLDLDHDSQSEDQDLIWRKWLKANKIMSIPVLYNKETKAFTVGFDPEAIDRCLSIDHLFGD